MSTQPYRVNLSIASPSEIESTAQQLMKIREGFLSTGSLALWTPRPLILDSWQRCRTLNVNPSRRCAPLAVTREIQLEQVRDENSLLLRAATPILNHLVDFLATSGYVVVLSDARGCLLEVVGDIAIRRRLARIDFIPGGNWSEAASGTNAIGTALSDGHIVQLMAAEHYCDGWQDLTCTAAPIHHPLTHEIIGILDVTGAYHLIRPFLTSFLAAAALEIQQRLQALLLSQSRDEWQQYHFNTLVRTLSKSHIENNQGRSLTLNKPSSFALTDVNHMDDIQSQLTLQERRARDAERLAAAAGVISASLDLNVTLEKVIEQAAHLLLVENANIYLFDETGKEITSVHTLSSYRAQRFPHREAIHATAALLKGAGAVSLIQERGEPVILDDVLLSTLLPLAFIEQSRIRSIMLLPLVTARGVSGFLTVSRAIPYKWTPDDIRLGLAFAAQSATAIENARLFDALQQHNRHIEALNAIAQILRTLPGPGQRFDLILLRIAEIMRIDTGMIILLDPNREHLTLAAHYQLASDVPLDLDIYPLKALQMIACRVIDLGEPLTISPDACDEYISESLFRAGFSHMMAVPIASSNTILGTLLIGNSWYECQSSESLKFYTTLGQQLGLAIKNEQLLRSSSEMEVLRQADKLKSGFLAAVSHDLRSPLTAIRASVESLLDIDGIQSALGKEHLLHNIAGQVNRLGQLVDQLLDLSKIEAGVLALDCDWTELSALVTDAANEFERLYPRCRIQLTFDSHLPLHYVDPARLLQVLWNLFENAYKYAPGELIIVEARLIEKEVLISVADRGPGIPRGEHEKIFERFYRLDRDQQTHAQGSGLGLAICRGIIDAHGGRVWVEDYEGKGSIFLLALPLPASEPIGLDTSEEHELLV